MYVYWSVGMRTPLSQSHSLGHVQTHSCVCVCERGREKQIYADGVFLECHLLSLLLFSSLCRLGAVVPAVRRWIVRVSVLQRTSRNQRQTLRIRFRLSVRLSVKREHSQNALAICDVTTDAQSVQILRYSTVKRDWLTIFPSPIFRLDVA